MARRSSVEMLARGLKRDLPRVLAASKVVQVAAQDVRVLVVRQRVEGGAAAVQGQILTISNHPTRAAIISGAALVATLALLEHSSNAECESLGGDDDTTSRSKYFDDDYEASQLLGSGSFGMVMQCVNKKDGHVAAVKMIQDVNDIREEVARETEALASIQRGGGHEHIVRYDGSYKHDGFHYIVTEFVEGESLYSLIQKHRQLDVKTALQLTAQMAEALSFLNMQNLIHRDLKPANIMIQQPTVANANANANEPCPLQLKIIDFGSAEHYTAADVTSKPKQAMLMSGTRCYWPPEVLESQETSPAMDMWALGCILYIMVSGRHPFDMMGTSSEAEIVRRIATDKVSFLHPVWSAVPCSVKSLIRGLLEKDPSTRLTVHEVLDHPAMRVV